MDAPKEAGVFKSNNFVDGRASLMRRASDIIYLLIKGSEREREKGKERERMRKRVNEARIDQRISTNPQ